jgi:hypothetical protein
MEVEVIGNAVSAHRVVPDSKTRLIAHFENLQHEEQKLVGEDLWESSVCEEQEKRMVVANWVLVEKHGMLVL